MVFFLGQLLNEYYFKPIQRYKDLKSRIAYDLTYYAMYYSNPLKNTDFNDDYSNASIELRKLAAEVNAMIELRPMGNVFIPRKKKLSEASKSLIGLSNRMYSADTITSLDNNQEDVMIIRRKLKLKSRGKRD